MLHADAAWVLPVISSLLYFPLFSRVLLPEKEIAFQNMGPPNLVVALFGKTPRALLHPAQVKTNDIVFYFV